MCMRRASGCAREASAHNCLAISSSVNVDCREPFDDMAIAVARGEIHRSIDARRIAAELMLHQACLFKELIPIDSGYEPHAGNRVAG